ncbi:hypothetical protein SAMN05192533_102296 [Mesobacillus persicus]|uniref:Uncharacterized protein n=1 Tax=Mesobacillus persicus TaxID=930146 RepID=A0A1H7XQK0_9BACI|nr:hypothetical protein [Mesobacillus persicus]SEM35447.1 hypothetical protein SAMN05192533_102296 [Mesobacillus persicus]
MKSDIVLLIEQVKCITLSEHEETLVELAYAAGVLDGRKFEHEKG